MARYLIIVLVALGIVLPQASAALAGLGLADGRMIVICTGDGLRTIRLNDAGEPVEISPEADLCALVHAADTAGRMSPVSAMPRLLHVANRILPSFPSFSTHGFSPSLPRGPPPG